MKYTIQGIIVTASLLTGGLALAQAPSSAAGGQQPPGQMQKAEKGMAQFQGFMAPTDPKALLERLHYANQQEIQQGQLAMKNAQNPDVKAFASMMVKDHTAMDQKLMTYAQSQGMKLGDMPKAMNDMEKKMMAKDKATLEELQVLTGAAFDSTYIAGQVGAHDQTLGKVMAAKQAMPTMDPQMTAMMQELTTKVPQHREQAWNILGKLDDGMAVGGSGGAMGNGTMGGSGTTGGNMNHGSMGHGTQGGTTAPTTPAPKK